MSTPNDHTAAKGLRGWWQSPPRHGMARLLAPYEYRHLHFFALTPILGGGIAAVAGSSASPTAYTDGQPSS
jgi:hypothetical protein